MGVQFEQQDEMDQDERGITHGGGLFVAALFKDRPKLSRC
jgi:hypothetical protein